MSIWLHCRPLPLPQAGPQARLNTRPTCPPPSGSEVGEGPRWGKGLVRAIALTCWFAAERPPLAESQGRHSKRFLAQPELQRHLCHTRPLLAEANGDHYDGRHSTHVHDNEPRTATHDTTDSGPVSNFDMASRRSDRVLSAPRSDDGASFFSSGWHVSVDVNVASLFSSGWHVSVDVNGASLFSSGWHVSADRRRCLP